MMKQVVTYFGVSSLIAASGAALLLCGLYPATGQEKGKGQEKPVSQEGVKRVESYRGWVKVNPKPVIMQPAPATQCASPFPSQLPSPHLQKYITVYVNKAGKEAMTRQKNAHFPVGTVIVKEKLSKSDSKSPELMTVMVKHEKGYNTDNGDWEYLVLDGTGKKVTAQGKLEKCQSCHRQYATRNTDFVYRDVYLPEKQQAALK